MDPATGLHNFQELLLSTPSAPPYFLLLVGLFTLLTCGFTFATILRQQVQNWSKNISPEKLPKRGRLQLLLPFWGIAGGILIVLACCLNIVGIPTLFAFTISLLVTVLVSYFAWSQLGKSLGRQIVRSYVAQSSEMPRQEKRT